MTEETLLELLRDYTEKTGNTSTFSHEIWIRPGKIIKEYDVSLFEGSSVRHSIREVNLSVAIAWMNWILMNPSIKKLGEQNDVQ